MISLTGNYPHPAGQAASANGELTSFTLLDKSRQEHSVRYS